MPNSCSESHIHICVLHCNEWGCCYACCGVGKMHEHIRDPTLRGDHRIGTWHLPNFANASMGELHLPKEMARETDPYSFQPSESNGNL